MVNNLRKPNTRKAAQAPCPLAKARGEPRHPLSPKTGSTTEGWVECQVLHTHWTGTRPPPPVFTGENVGSSEFNTHPMIMRSSYPFPPHWGDGRGHLLENQNLNHCLELTSPHPPTLSVGAKCKVGTF